MPDASAYPGIASALFLAAWIMPSSARSSDVTPHFLPASDEVRRFVVPKIRDRLSWEYSTLFFITNRRINEIGDLKLPNSLKGTAVDYDHYFTSTSDTAIALGEACVTVSLGRKPAEQTYESDAEMEIPARQFILIRTEILAPDDFRNKMTHGAVGDTFDKKCPEDFDSNPAKPMLFIHGWLTPFTAAMTRAAQLKIDLHRNRMVVLTWPSDKAGWPTQSYDDAAAEEAVAAKLLPFTLTELKKGFGTYPDVLAHSMGAKLYSDGIGLITQSGLLATPGEINVPKVAFAAPDVDLKDFQAGFTKFKSVNNSLAVYCTFDLALYGSKNHNGGVRLGFCKSDEELPKAPEEMIQVKGHIHDAWRHSYFLSAPEMIDDLIEVFSRSLPLSAVSINPLFDSRILMLK